MSKALYTRKTFYSQPTDFRIGAIVSDGMWYSLPKWRKLARCEEDELQEWIARYTASGDLEQSATGAKSYRFLLPAIRKWYHEHGYSLENDQLIDFLFPPRIWDNQTENDGFLAAPLRTVSIVSFTADTKTASAVQEGLRGVARVREVSPGKYKAYGLEPSHINAGINEVAKELGQIIKTYTRSEASRRELVDFTPAFANRLVLFYRQFGHTLVKPMMDTIRIFIPDPEDQESQIVIWVLTAIEKFDESSSVPFSGYLNSVLRRWPYDLPAMYLGKELSAFQRERSRALKALAEEAGGKTIPNEKIAETLGLQLYDFLELEEKHRAWVRSQTATTLSWDENADEKSVESNLSGDLTAGAGDTDVELANRISIAVIQAALETQDFASSYFLISQIDTAELDLGNIRTLSAPFVAALAKNISG